MHAIYRLTTTETKLILREPIIVFFAVLLPPVLLTILGLVPSFREPSADMGGARPIDLYSPIVITMAMSLLALSVLPQIFSGYREKGILRRLATTPVRPAALLVAQLLMCTVLALVALVAVLVIGRLAFDVPLPANIPGFALVYLFSLGSLLGLGLLVASVAPTSSGAGALGSILFFPLMFLGGLWAPRESMSELLRTISDFSPIGPIVAAMADTAAGQWPQPLHLLVMVGWAVLTGGLAARLFRWQ
ncbi:ABC transporter permease [Actinophytocola sediminis]